MSSRRRRATRSCRRVSRNKRRRLPRKSEFSRSPRSANGVIWNATSTMFKGSRSDPRLMRDLSRSGEVGVEKQETVLALPLRAVHDRTGNPTVQVREGDRFVDRAVTLGIHNEEQIAVLSGLKPGDEIRLP